MKPLAEQGWLEKGPEEGDALRGLGMSRGGGGRWPRAVCHSELALSAAGEKGKRALGVPPMKEAGGKKKADLTHHILRAQDVQPARGSVSWHSISSSWKKWALGGKVGGDRDPRSAGESLLR